MPKDQPYLEAEKKIEAALKSGATELYLSWMGLTTLPNSLCQLKELQILDIHDNSLTSLPKCLDHLTNLQFLDISRNKFETLPDSIGRLTTLKEIYFDDQPLSINDSIRNLKQLEVIGAYKCGLELIPDWISELH